jgi:phytoene dehydrogenase-like protein
VLVIGAGHNGLACALLLAQQGLTVRVVEDKNALGGAVRTEKPFPKAPELATSTGAYLLGLMPPELVRKMGVELPLVRRDPHYFLPSLDGRYLMFGSDRAAMEAQFVSFFSRADWEANLRLEEELAQLREDIAPTWLSEPLSIEATAQKYVRPKLQQHFVDLCRGSVGDYLDRFGFESDLVRAMFAVTDGFSGLYGTWDTPGTGMNFLVHNMCRLPGSDGTWMIVRGGMGTVTRTLAEAAQNLGVTIELGDGVKELSWEGGKLQGVVTRSGKEHRAKVVISNADPFRMQALIGKERLPAEYNARIESYIRPGSTMKVNLALSDLPKFTCLPPEHQREAFGPTIHLLPAENDVMRSLKEGFADVQAGRLSEFPTIEWYIHTTVDPSLKDAAGHHNSALFVQWVPRDIAGSSWEAEESRYVKHLLSICDRFAPGFSDCVIDAFPLHPRKIEEHFGISYGHIHHVDNSFGFSDRLAYATPIDGLYSCSAGTHPAGSVIGAAGHNAAMRVLADLGKPQSRA